MYDGSFSVKKRMIVVVVLRASLRGLPGMAQRDQCIWPQILRKEISIFLAGSEVPRGFIVLQDGDLPTRLLKG